MSTLRKMMRFPYVIVAILAYSLLGPPPSRAQYDMVWAFGFHAGLDFRTSPPGSFVTEIRTAEAAASVCNRSGNLLFYSDGSKVWNKNHKLMPNGADLTGFGNDFVTGTTTQGIVIVPAPGDSNLYYLFSIGGTETRGSGLMWYSMVDMRLNNGLGDIVPGKKAIGMDYGLTEKMVAVSGTDCNVWLLVVPHRGEQFKAYRIGLDGLDTIPVVSRIEKLSPMAIVGSMDVSPNGKKVFLDTRLYDFNPDEGTVSNPITLPGQSCYAVCFSPDNSKLYRAERVMEQFDISSNDSATIVRSRYRIADAVVNMRRSPDHKLYLNMNASSRMAIVHQPDAPGLSCQYDSMGVDLQPGTSGGLSMPNYIAVAKDRYRSVQRQFYDTIFCAQESLLQASANTGINYSWNTGDTTQQITITQSGVYWVSYEINSVCTYDSYTDTFRVYFDTVPRLQTTYTAKELYCPGDTLILYPAHSGGSDYSWNTGSRANTMPASDTGMYWVDYGVDSICTVNRDSFIVRYTKEKLRLKIDLDTLVCTEEALDVKNVSDDHYHHFDWNMGNGRQLSGRDIAFSYPEAGNYLITLYGTYRNVCIDSIKRLITVDVAETLPLWIDRDSLCIGQSIRAWTELNPTTVRDVQWQFGADQFHTDGIALLEHAFHEKGVQPVTLLARFRACPDMLRTDSVYVAPIPLLLLGPDTSLCFAARTLTLYNHYGPNPGDQYTWNTGDTSTAISITRPGFYRLQIRNADGCIATESIEIRKDCYTDIPNAFSPNGDGSNDYFFPQQQLSRGVLSLHLQIRNRWGQLLFESRERNGRGWDGRWAGQEQPAGVYLYQLTVKYSNGREEVLQGNVTLVR